MTSVRLELAAPRSRVKHSTTEPLRSLSDVWRGVCCACSRCRSDVCCDCNMCMSDVCCDCSKCMSDVFCDCVAYAVLVVGV